MKEGEETKRPLKKPLTEMAVSSREHNLSIGNLGG